MQTGIIDFPWYLPLDSLPKASCMSLGCPWSLHFAIWQLILLAISSPMRTAMHCQGPASAESRDTLRMNGVSERWHGETKLRWSGICSFIFKRNFYTLSYTFPKVKDQSHAESAQHSISFDLYRNQAVFYIPFHLQGSYVMYIIFWPGGLLTFYDPFLVKIGQPENLFSLKVFFLYFFNLCHPQKVLNKVIFLWSKGAVGYNNNKKELINSKV